VEIRTSTRVSDPAALLAEGFDAVLLATGTHGSMNLRVPGEDQAGVVPALTFLAQAKLGDLTSLAGRTVVVVGGGNVAVDAARTARRLGAERVRMVSLERRDEMPALDLEIDETLAEGVEIDNAWGVTELTGSGQVDGLRLRRCTATFDADGRFNPSFDDSTTRTMPADLVVTAIGMFADTDDLGLATNRNRTLEADPSTLETSVDGVFAAGDVVTGPSMITNAIGHGRRAAFMIDRYLRAEAMDGAEFDRRLPMVAQDDVLARQHSHSRRDPLEPVHTAPTLGFDELEPPLTPEQVAQAASRCLDCGVCSECHSCVDVCPAGSIDLNAQPEHLSVEVGTVIVSTGYRLFPADAKPQYGFGRYPNVITGMQMDRLLAPTRPYNTVLRPGDGKVPDRIAYVMCTGSRDATVGNPLCSRVCCMYSVKQNQLIMGELPLADVTVHYIDIRAVGKGYDEFFSQTADMGAQFIKGRVADITEKDNGDLVLTYEDIDNGGGMTQAEYDLVVLAVGVLPTGDVHGLFSNELLKLDEHLYVAEVDECRDPGRTSIDGVFVAGTASGAKDIQESILHAGAAVAQAAAHLARVSPSLPTQSSSTAGATR
jgi:NADPH-dependent glutamate synthase beta subunit-like oxidoreductase